MRALMLFVLVASLGDASCSTTGNGIAEGDYWAAYRDAWCRNAVTCGELANMDACAAVNFGVPTHFDLSTEAAIADGTIAFDPDKARACIDAIAASSCDVTSQSGRTIPAVCDHVIQGTRLDGEPCALSAECASDACAVHTDPNACVQGTCLGSVFERAKVGDACGITPCVDDAYCDTNTHVCFGLKQLGEVCSYNTCAYGLTCSVGTTSVCVLPVALGQSCVTTECETFNLACPSATSVCTKRGLLGDACSAAQPCSLAYNCDGSTGRCAAGGMENQPCTRDSVCGGEGLFCFIASPNVSTGLCKAPLPGNADCSHDFECESGVCGSVCTTDRVCI